MASGSDEKSIPVESSYGYDVEYRNVYFSFFNDLSSRSYYNNKQIYDYYIKDRKALMVTVDVTATLYDNYIKQTKELSSVLQSLTSILKMSKEANSKRPVLFLIHNINDKKKLASDLEVYLQDTLRDCHFEDAEFLIIKKEDGSDNGLYEGLEWLLEQVANA